MAAVSSLSNACVSWSTVVWLEVESDMRVRDALPGSEVGDGFPPCLQGRPEGRPSGLQLSGRGGLLRRAFGLFGKAGKCGRARHRELRKTLAVERDAGVLEPVDHLPVGESVLARRRIDAHDPQPPEIALLATPPDERVLQRSIDRFLSGAIQLALVGVIALRQAQQLLPLRPTDCSSLYTRHFCS